MMYPKSIGPGILHLLCRCPGLLLVAAISIGVASVWPGTNVPKECAPGGLVSFEFDDGYESTFTKAFPILKKHGCLGTLFVITSKIGEPNRINREQLKTLYENGWEIGSHTVSHPHLTELSREQLEYELGASKAWLEGEGFEVRNFASPYGEYNETVLEVVRKYYSSHRTVWYGINTLPLKEDERYYLRAVKIHSETTVEEICDWVKRAKEEEVWLILVFHRIDEEGEWNWSSEQLEQVVRFVHDQGLCALDTLSKDTLLKGTAQEK